MANEYICDGCGKRESAVFYPNGNRNWCKPERWFQRTDENGPQDACSRDCVDKIAKKSGKTGVILPI